MLVVGLDGDKIKWTEIITIESPELEELKVYGVDLTNDITELVPKFEELIKKYWKKPNMENYSYLSGDIDLPIFYELLIVIINMIGSFFVFRYMFKHEL